MLTMWDWSEGPLMICDVIIESRSGSQCRTSDLSERIRLRPKQILSSKSRDIVGMLKFKVLSERYAKQLMRS